MAKLKLDLHDIYNRGGQIDAELNRIVQEALAKKIALVEIIPGKGSGQLKKTVLGDITCDLTAEQPDMPSMQQPSQQCCTTCTCEVIAKQ